MRRFTPQEIKAIKKKREAGATWVALGQEYGITGQGLRRSMEALWGKVKPLPRICPYCKEEYQPVRDDCVQCGKPDCKLQHRREHWARWHKGARPQRKPKDNEIMTTCIGHYCGGRSFLTKAVKYKDRTIPLYRLCPNCRERNQEVCDAW